MMSDPPITLSPVTMPQSAEDRRLYEWILTRRSLAFFIDAMFIMLFTVSGYVLVLLLGLVTFGLTWLFLGLVFPVVALGYYALTLGVRGSTPGMGAVGVRLISSTGTPIGALPAMGHAILFWISVVILTPLALLVCFFNRRGRLLHDMALDCTLVNDLSRARP